jgi:DNA mismatch repair endonuclease MutH
VSGVLRRAIGLKAKLIPAHLEALGLEIKTIPLGPNAEPYEAMSFPFFDPRELVGEEWEDSDLLAGISNMLLVPIYREQRDIDLLQQRVCRPFRWSPDREQMSGIRAEWERYREAFSVGSGQRMPTESETRFIHVRPHGRDAKDRIELPDGRTIVKQSFWLNRDFVRELVLGHHGDWMGF